MRGQLGFGLSWEAALHPIAPDKNGRGCAIYHQGQWSQ